MSGDGAAGSKKQILSSKKEIKIVDNEVHALEGEFKRRPHGGRGYYWQGFPHSSDPRWHSCEPTTILAVSTKGSHEAPIPNAIPPQAREILIHAYFFSNKGNSSGHRDISIETRDGKQRYKTVLRTLVLPKTNSSASWANTNAWLPVTLDRKIHVIMPYSIPKNGGQLFLRALGWR